MPRDLLPVARGRLGERVCPCRGAGEQFQQGEKGGRHLVRAPFRLLPLCRDDFPGMVPDAGPEVVPLALPGPVLRPQGEFQGVGPAGAEFRCVAHPLAQHVDTKDLVRIGHYVDAGGVGAGPGEVVVAVDLEPRVGVRDQLLLRALRLDHERHQVEAPLQKVVLVHAPQKLGRPAADEILRVPEPGVADRVPVLERE